MTVVPDFEALYRGEPDPWRVGSSFYEQRKLALVLGALSRPRYEHAWDPASGTGHLAARLAARCRSVLATDGAAEAVKITQQACAGLDNVIVGKLALPEVETAAASGPFDLVVVSEFLYYLTDRDRAAALAGFEDLTGSGAELVAVHWRRHPHDAWLSGAAVQAEMSETLLGHGWQLGVRLEDPEFVLNSWHRLPDSRS